MSSGFPWVAGKRCMETTHAGDTMEANLCSPQGNTLAPSAKPSKPWVRTDCSLVEAGEATKASLRHAMLSTDRLGFY